MTRLAEDRTLREAFRRGERWAFEEVYREYARSVFELLSRKVGMRARHGRVFFNGGLRAWELEDAVQTIFLRAFSEKARLAYDGLRPYRNYLFAIASNLLIDLLRSGRGDLFRVENAREPTAPDGESFDFELSCADPTPEERSADSQMRQHVASFIGALSPGEREIFSARFEHGLSVEACARDLRVSEHRVKACEKKLKKRFYYYMRQHGYFEGYEHLSQSIDNVVETILLLAFVSDAWGTPWGY